MVVAGAADVGVVGLAALVLWRAWVVVVWRAVEVVFGLVVDVVDEEEVEVVDAGAWKATGTTSAWASGAVVVVAAPPVRRMAGSWWRVGTPAMATPTAAQSTSMATVIER